MDDLPLTNVSKLAFRNILKAFLFGFSRPIKEMKKYLLFFCSLFLVSSQDTLGQSFAYKALLSGIYDRDFPVIYPGNGGLWDQALILDAREKEEFEVSHIKDARWIGFETFSLRSLQKIPKDRIIILYCSIGARSQEVGKKLREAGFSKVYNLYGGIFHWVNEGYPVYSRGLKTEKVHAYSTTWGIWLQKGEKVYSKNSK